jgi:DNA-binding FadR family transcriptional regulator
MVRELALLNKNNEEKEEMGSPLLRKPNLKNRVYELLLGMIIEGKYKIGEMLPPEKILCEEIGVSRTVIREVIKLLEAKGVIEVIHGKGIKVLPPTMRSISNAFMLYLQLQQQEVSKKDLIVVRYAIEPEIARQATLHARDTEIHELSDIIIKKAEQVLDDTDAYVTVDLDFHLKLAHMTHNILFITIIESLISPLRKSIMETVYEDGHGHNEHTRVFQYVKERNADKAKEMMEAHLEHVKNIFKARDQL